MKHTRLLQLLLMLVVSVVAISCGGGKSDPPPAPPPTPSLEVNPTSLAFVTTGESKTFAITSNVSWTAESDQNWCSLSAASGQNSSTITVTVTANTDLNKRPATITVKSATLTKTISVEQLGEAPDMIIDLNDRILDPATGNLSIGITTNVPYTVEIVSSGNWIAQKAKSKAMTEYTEEFTYGDNSTTTPRSATITFKSDKISKSLKATQKPAQATKEITIVDTEEAVTVETAIKGDEALININTKEVVTDAILEDGVNWVKILIDSTPVKSGNKIDILVDSNSGETRQTEILLKQSTRTDTLVIKQIGSEKKSLVISPSHLALSSSGQSSALEIVTNTDFDYKITDKNNTPIEWLTAKLSPSRDSLRLVVSGNTTYDNRQALVKFYFKGETNPVATTTIDQLRTQIISIKPKTLNVDAQAGEYTIEVSQNDAYTFICGAEWIRPIETKGIVRNQVKFTISANNSTSARSTTVLFKIQNANIADTLYVNQEGFKEILVASPETINSEATGGAFTVNVKHNIDYTVNISSGAEWVKRVVSRATTDSQEHFEIAKNSEFSPRTAIIFIEGENSKLRDTIIIEQVGAKVVYPQREALIELYNATGGAQWGKATNWNSELPLNQWYGINTDPNDPYMVTSINLSKNNLIGQLPANIWQSFTGLESLDLGGNQLSGELISLESLMATTKVIKLNANKFSGPIPRIRHLEALTTLDLGLNQLTGSIPDFFVYLVNLSKFNCAYNKMSGTIPSEVKKHPYWNQWIIAPQNTETSPDGDGQLDDFEKEEW